MNMRFIAIIVTVGHPIAYPRLLWMHDGLIEEVLHYLYSGTVKSLRNTVYGGTDPEGLKYNFFNFL